MNLKNSLKNPYIQGAILVVGLILYLLSPNDAFRLLTGALVAITIIGLVVLEIKEGAKTEEQPKSQEDETDKKVREMVEKTKKFAEGKEETAADLLKQVEKENPE